MFIYMCIVVSLYIAESVGNNKHLRVEAFTDRCLKVVPFIEKNPTKLRGSLVYNIKANVNKFCKVGFALNRTKRVSPKPFGPIEFYNYTTTSRGEDSSVVVVDNFANISASVV
jgi:hypothetical protein